MTLTHMYGEAIFPVMAGQPVLRSLERFVANRGGDSFVLDQLADGVSVGKVARGIVLEGHGAISRPFLYKWRDQSEARQQGWALAVKAGAEAHADRAGDVLDEIPEDPSPAQVARAKALSEYSKWRATVQDRERFGGQDSKLRVELDVGQALAGLLRDKGSMDKYKSLESKDLALSEGVEDAEYELLGE